MDLSSFAADQDGLLHLYNPNIDDPRAEREYLHHDDGRPLQIWMWGLETQQFLDAQDAAEERRLKEVRKNNTIMSGAKTRASDVAFLIQITKGWPNGLPYKGEIMEFNHHNAFKLYTEQHWVRGQMWT